MTGQKLVHLLNLTVGARAALKVRSANESHLLRGRQELGLPVQLHCPIGFTQQDVRRHGPGHTVNQTPLRRQEVAGDIAAIFLNLRPDLDRSEISNLLMRSNKVFFEKLPYPTV